MKEAKYNGWTNWETWVTNLHFDDVFTDRAQEIYGNAEADETFSREERAALDLADVIRETVGETTDFLEGGKNLFIADIIGGFLSAVNWYEMAKNYVDEVNREEQTA